jgi:hypothetical protein
VKRTAGLEAVLRGTLSLDFVAPPPLVLAISADETQHLLWRLTMGGELTPGMCSDKAVIFSLLIGTNNLGNANHSPDATAKGILAVVHELLHRTRGKILVNALLPRGQPPKSPSNRRFVPLMPKVRHVNEQLKLQIAELKTRSPDRVRLVDCGAMFLSPHRMSTAGPRWNRTNDVNIELMPDALHPSLAGQRVWASCLRRALKPFREQLQPPG